MSPLFKAVGKSRGRSVKLSDPSGDDTDLLAKIEVLVSNSVILIKSL